VTPAEILAGLESCTIAKFGHAEHVAAAWEALRLQPFAAAAARICTALQRFAAHHGQSTRYSLPMTLGFLRLIDARRGCLSWEQFRAANKGVFDRSDPAVRNLLHAPMPRLSSPAI